MCGDRKHFKKYLIKTIRNPSRVKNYKAYVLYGIRDMQRDLGKTGMRVSEIGLGTELLG